MEPAASSELIQDRMEKSAAEVQDFDRVVQLYWARIHRFLLVSIRDQDLAESLTQDCFMRAYRCRNQFRGDAAVHTWLMRIAVNLARDCARNRKLQFWKRTRNAGIDAGEISNWLPASDLSPESNALLKERIQAVWRETEKLPERQRTVFLLRFVEDMDILEIAQATGLKEGAVKVHLFRALQKIRNRIGNAR